MGGGAMSEDGDGSMFVEPKPRALPWYFTGREQLPVPRSWPRFVKLKLKRLAVTRAQMHAIRIAVYTTIYIPSPGTHTAAKWRTIQDRETEGVRRCGARNFAPIFAHRTGSLVCQEQDAETQAVKQQLKAPHIARSRPCTLGVVIVVGCWPCGSRRVIVQVGWAVRAGCDHRS